MALQVLGSINMDAVMRLARLPNPGETVAGAQLAYLPGGKGANQAVAAARAGAPTQLIGAVGDDGFGEAMMAFLAEAGVGTAHVRRIADRPTGTAHVWVGAEGENQIAVAGGANAGLEPADIAAAASPGGVRLAQLETPVPVVEAFFRAGRRDGALCILNAAPALETGAALFALADLLVLNESEACRYLGLAELPPAHEAAGGTARRLIARGGQRVVLTLGARGALLIGEDGLHHLPARAVDVVDTTGAGDCFCGVLAASLLAGAALAQAMEAATAASSIAVQRAGAAVAMPTRAEIAALL